MEDDVLNPFRKMSMRTRKIAPNMEAALASIDNRTHVSFYHCLVDFKKVVLIFYFRQHLCYEPDLGRVAASEAWEERHVAGLGIQINARDG